MRILIAGAGLVGFNLARELVADGQDVAVIDADAERVRRVAEKLDVLTVQGHAAVLADLKRAGLKQAELFAAVTEVDEVNLLACYLAGESGVPRRVARARHLQWSGEGSAINLAALHVDRVVNPDRVVVEGVRRLVATPGAFEAADFAEGKILLRGFELPANSPMAGRTLATYRELGLEGTLVVGIIRGRTLHLPTGADETKAGDHIFFLAAREALPRLLAVVVPDARPARRVVIAGGDAPAVHLAEQLSNEIPEVALIEPDADRAEAAAATLRKATVLRGEATDAELLREARCETTDVFVAFGARDDENLLAGLLAKRQGAKRAVVLANEPASTAVFTSIGIDAVVNPRLMTVGEILRELRRGSVHAVAKLQEFEAEAVEIEVLPGSPVIGKPLSALTFPRGALVGAVLRHGVPLIPRGDTVLEAGSTVICFALPGALDRVAKLFRARGRPTREAVKP